MRGVLHHLPEPATALKGLKELLKPNGQLVLYEPNLSCVFANFMKWVLKQLFKITMEESPYGQLSQKSIRQAIQEAGFTSRAVWYSSLLAFPLTGDYGRRPILPNSKRLFQMIVAVDRFASRVVHLVPIFARWSHFRVIFLLEVAGGLAGSPNREAEAAKH
jgi:SAM-dependent methyltransferase